MFPIHFSRACDVLQNQFRPIIFESTGVLLHSRKLDSASVCFSPSCFGLLQLCLPQWHQSQYTTDSRRSLRWTMLSQCWYLLDVTAISCAVLHHLWFGYRWSTRFMLNLHISHIVTLLLPQLDSPTPFADGKAVFYLMLNFFPHLWSPHSLSSAGLDTNQNDDTVQGSLSPPV